ncbi:hypothetical protein RAS12_07630 [Achromobacter seleniivolatilans]|uniref:Uncharacterized protein n=1 Tax=Achromobacter seleniivolatilans TaxID=3047478 RepID=A0ABY9M623_9BURK|nr:hypothetical protein [Achromobacter sp. R39]WMD22240.1 hypothetical protein RAS12_07630 [Achromobacter sp. R39]
MTSHLKKSYSRLEPFSAHVHASILDFQGTMPFSTYGSRAVDARQGREGSHPGLPIGDRGPVGQAVSLWEAEGGSILSFAGVSRPFVLGNDGSMVHWPVLAWKSEES